MKKCIRVLSILCLCSGIILHVFPVSANEPRGTYMSSANVYAAILEENDVVGRAVVPCLSKVREIDVNMYLQRAYGNVWRNVTSAYNMNETDISELDRSAIIYNVSPGTYRVYIEVTVIGYDGLIDPAEVGTGAFVINT